MTIIRKIDTLIKAIKGICLKLRFIFYNPQSFSLHSVGNLEGSVKVIISLTSYGRRVEKVLPFALISLLRQTRRPNKIVVWLDNSWNDNNLPKCLCKFVKAGVEFKYCDDYKSFKKLIPSLNEYPDDIIITCDDDLFYSKYMVERLLDAHRSHPNTICCQLAHGIVKKDGLLLPYNQWTEEIYDEVKNVFPLGGAGCLYKREYLHGDIVNYELANSLAPKADDVWFYFMGLIKGANRYVLPYQKNNVLPLDAFYQFFHSGSSLMDDNLSQGLNDKQIEAVLNHYSIKKKEIC